ncbi:PPE family protein [Mycobacterium sp. Marseille-P9652]|uniref:PPE family protein n=1 Tax=Mycobacterium sp. Marseille-P9652 TaxID=2654950 RepID=UPI00210796D0|nr:PPE family protein [Mycobacterium sp. Marseille-P9652]
MDFGALPPEINSARMYAGPGPGSLVAAAVAWDGLAAELHTAASLYKSVIAGLVTNRWMGPTSLAMASAFGPYVAWVSGAAARAAESASHARLSVEIYEAAFAMTVPPPAVAANRAQLAALIATNFFGQNLPAIAATEAEYGEMWAQDAAAMYQYAAHAAAATEVTPFASPPEVTSPAGLGQQAAAVTQAASVSAESQFSLASLVSSVPATLQALTTPATAMLGTSTSSAALSSTLSSTISSFTTNLPYSLPTWLMAGATPLYGLSSVLGIAQTVQGLAKAAGDGVAAAAAGAASGVASAAGSAGALGSSVFGSLGTASALGPLSVPASWTSVIPTAPVSAAAALPNALGTPAVPPTMLGSLPRLASATKSLGPRYGIVPTIMTRPPAGGYA